MKGLFCAFASMICLAGNEARATDAPPRDMPHAGTRAPDFNLPSQEEREVSLRDYRGKWVVLYFYPKDFTGGCTMEAHKFQADIDKYRAKNAVILGVSVDSVDSHKGFCAKEGLDFKLLSDAQHAVSDAYGSVMEHDGVILSARHTFIIDPEGMIRLTYAKVDPLAHDAQVLADLEQLQAEQR